MIAMLKGKVMFNNNSGFYGFLDFGVSEWFYRDIPSFWL
jgi:hypothetical protein